MGEVVRLERKEYHVSYLVSLSTLPCRFYALIHDLNGRAVEYGNPGLALQSYLVAKCLRNEIVELTESAQEYVYECEGFSSSKKILNIILESLVNSASEVMINMTNQLHQVQIAMYRDITELQKLIQNAKLTFDAFLSIQGKGDEVDLFTMPGTKLKQSFYNLQDKIEVIVIALNRVGPPLEKA